MISRSSSIDDVRTPEASFRAGGLVTQTEPACNCIRVVVGQAITGVSGNSSRFG